VIFCRNVLIYFTPDAIRQTVERLCGLLRREAIAFIGLVKTLRAISRQLRALPYTWDVLLSQAARA